MSDEATDKSGRTWLYVVGILASQPLLYFLSVGPAFVLVARRIIPSSAFLPVYKPLIWVGTKTGTQGATLAYVEARMKLTATPLPRC